MEPGEQYAIIKTGLILYFFPVLFKTGHFFAAGFIDKLSQFRKWHLSVDMSVTGYYHN
jgi:hypothetical protein